ncbi:MAG: HWE histidine kinase domain-containing protein [Oceanicaulis sp.]
MTADAADMTTAVDRFDWAQTPLGPREAWPHALDCAVRLALAAPFPMIVMGGSNAIVAAYNDAYAPLLADKPCPLGKPIIEAWAEAADQIGPEIEAALAGATVRRDQVQFELDRSGRRETAWFDYSFSPILDTRGAPVGVLNAGKEITRQVRSAQEVKTLLDELSHRVKNTLAVVNGLAALSFRDEADSPGLHRFRERLQALASTHDLLFEGDANTADLRALIRRAVGACADQSRFGFSGPELQISAGVATKLALILHELCTNAVKYGALSNESGEVRLGWEAGADGALVHVRWRERGGPVVEDTSRRGFGSELISRLLQGVPEAKVDLRLEPAGAECDIDLPLQQ